MKKILILALAAISLVACNQTSKTESRGTEEEAAGKTLVAYFSATGTTQAAAELLAQALSADLFEIAPEQPYSEDDLNWRDSLSRSSVEMKDASFRPAIKSMPDDMARYDTVYIGFPIWWGVAPRIINTFIENASLDGVTVIPFATSGGSEIEPALDALSAAYPDIAFGEGRLLNDVSPADIEAWVAQP